MKLEAEIERKLRIAVAKLNNWAIDAGAEEIRDRGDHLDFSADSIFESLAFERMADDVARAAAWFLAKGYLDTRDSVKEALAIAEHRRRPRLPRPIKVELYPVENARHEPLCLPAASKERA